MFRHTAFFTSRFHYLGGFLGVDVFFVLSGFLITTLLVQEAAGSGRIGLGRFYARRALRLLPALGVLLILGALVVWRLGSNPDGLPYPVSVLVTLSYFGNWFGAKIGILAHTWSLAVEEQYYLVWPLILTFAFRRGRSLRSLAVASAVAATCVAVIRLVMFLGGHPVPAFYWTITRGDGVLWGSALALAVAAGVRWVRALLRPAALAAAGGAGVFAISLVVHPGDPRLFWGLLVVVELGAAVVIGHVTMHTRSALSRVLALPPLPAIGRISYGLYLFHWPVFNLVHGLSIRWSGASYTAVAFALTFAVATGSYLLVERRALRAKPVPSFSKPK
jgi:peptidoglycan/LPS O-acetylase OafA/YrhL